MFPFYGFSDGLRRSGPSGPDGSTKLGESRLRTTQRLLEGQVLLGWMLLRCSWEAPLLFSSEEDDSLSLVKDNSHNSSFELAASMITSYQPVNQQRSAGKSTSSSSVLSSPCLFRPSFLGSASTVGPPLSVCQTRGKTKSSCCVLYSHQVEKHR